MALNNLEMRTLSGIVYVSLTTISILVHPLFFGILGGMVTMLAMLEFNYLMHSNYFYRIASTICGGWLFATIMTNRLLPDMQGDNMQWMYFAYFTLVIIALIAGLFLKRENPIADWGTFLSAQCMIALPFAMMNCIYSVRNTILLGLFVLIWLNDSAAYVVGSLTAKLYDNHKMIPRVSPAKSWEGLIGGAVFTIALAMIFVKIGWLQTSLWKAFVFGLVTVVFGTLGDLMESIMKRTLGVKDSGKFMPGHGGVLDRFDSMLLATPAIWILMSLWPGW